MNFKQIRVRDLLLVNDEGEVVEGNWPVNQAAFVIHSQVHAARPDVVAAAHAHSLYGKAWSALRRPLDPLTQDACAFYGDHAVVRRLHRRRASTSRRASASPTPSATTRRRSSRTTACSPSASTVDEAAWWFITMERTLPGAAARRGGRHAVPIDDDQAEKTAAQVGQPPLRLARRSSPSTTGSSPSSPTCSRSRAPVGSPAAPYRPSPSLAWRAMRTSGHSARSSE